jgi:hypothetical protein
MLLRYKLIIVFLLAVAVRLGFHLWTGFMADDAFITFRYAENIASGNGFVYNAGDRVLGTSTPLFTWILAFLSALRIPVIAGALAVSLACAGLTASVLFRFATYLRFGSLAWLPAIAYALWPRSVPADSCGMETALFTLVITSAFYFFHRRLNYYAVGCATLAVLTRPEGVLLLIVILIGTIIRDRARLNSYLMTSALLLVPWMLFSYIYFESVIPNSIPAKLALYSRFGAETWFARLGFMLGLHNPAGWLVTLAALFGGYWLYRKQNFGRAELIWLGTMLAFFTVGRTHLFFWYPSPLYPILLLLACAAAPMLFDRYPAMRRSPLWSRGLALLLAVALLAGLYRPASHYLGEQIYSETVLKAAGLYLAGEIVDLNVEIAAEDIGYLGYYSDRRIFDRDGLVSREAAGYNRDGRYLDLILDRNPDWVGVTNGSPISGFADSSAFLEQYEPVRSFADSMDRRYTVYRRN